MTQRIGPASAPMAFLSDIHGNLPALEAVLRELSQLGVVDIFVAGNLLLGGEQPLEVFRRLKSIGARCIRGPGDVALAHIDPGTLKPADDEERQKAQRFADTKRQLGELVLRELGNLPEHLRLPMIDGRELLLVHGSPASMHDTISHELADEEIEALLCDDPADIFVCGGTHVPFLRVLGEVEICNAGTVGAAPEGSLVHYSIITPRTNGATITQHFVEY